MFTNFSAKSAKVGLWMALLCTLMAASYASAASADQSAHEVVKETTDELMQVVQQNRQLLESDPQAYFAKVKDVLDPVVDFPFIARNVMGPYWEKASEQQRRQFVETFKNSLIETYAKGMANYADLDTRILPPSGDDEGARKAGVVQEITGPDGTNRVAYTMMLHRTGEWRLTNMVLNGVNLGKTFRNQFAQAVKQHDGDLDAVISNWSADT